MTLLDTKKDTPFSFAAFRTGDLIVAVESLAIDACSYHDGGLDVAAVAAIRLARKARAELRRRLA